jgi:aspartate kinase
VTEGMEVTTLGRGGSDTTAVALAVSLKADMCHIYTDVEGVFTADPRIVPEARRIPEIDYEEMVELATYGAKVMHPRAVEIGQIYNMPILVACSFNDKPGTVIRGGIPMEIRNKARGIAHDLNVAKVTVLAVPDKPGIAATLFEPLAAANVSIDTIVQNSSVSGMTDLTFTVSRNDLSKAMKVVEPIAKSIGAKGCVSDAKLGKVSIVGTGMQNTPGYAARMFRALYEAGINIELITTSEIRITCIVNETRVADAVRSLHKAFRLDQE